jgi:hypothetical protein
MHILNPKVAKLIRPDQSERRRPFYPTYGIQFQFLTLIDTQGAAPRAMNQLSFQPQGQIKRQRPSANSQT